jgi:hypothetical protein
MNLYPFDKRVQKLPGQVGKAPEILCRSAPGIG